MLLNGLFAGILSLTGIFDSFLASINNNIFVQITTGVLTVITIMRWTSEYFFAMFPQTAQMIYGWIFWYFIVWFVYQTISIVTSFIPRRIVIR